MHSRGLIQWLTGLLSPAPPAQQPAAPPTMLKPSALWSEEPTMVVAPQISDDWDRRPDRGDEVTIRDRKPSAPKRRKKS